MKKIAKLLKADFNESSDLASIAAMLAGKGRGNDTLLAHITPREAEILKAAGGSGTTNPETGLLEFYDGEGVDYTTAPDQSAAETARLQGAEDRIQATRYSPDTATQEDLSFGPRKVPEGVLIDPNTGQAMPTRYEPSGTSAPTFFRESGVYSPAQGSAQVGVNTQIPSTPYVATSADRAALFGEGGYGAKASPTELAVPSPAPQEKSFFDKLTTEQMARLGLAGGLGVYGATQAKRGAQQAQQAAAEQKAVGAPYQAKGQELIRAAETGELTPTSQASLQALQARLAQGAETRGGVGAAQVAAQAEAYRQQLLAQQYDLGLKVSNIGDNIALGAIKTGLQADQALNQASANFYTNLAAIGAGIPMARRD
jgi:hypothetical protein